MKKIVVILSVLFLAASLTGCGNENKAVKNQASEGDAESSEAESTNQDTFAQEPKKTAEKIAQIRIGSASMGGGSYTVGNAIAQLINEKMTGIKGFNQETSGSGENITLLENGEIEIGLIMGATLQQAVDGTGSFEGMKCKNLSEIGSYKFDTYHIYTYTGAKINSVSELKGKKIGVGPMGGGIEVNADILLNAYGISKNDYTSIYGTVGDMYEQLKVGQIDALIHCANTGTAQPADALASGKVSLLGIDPEKSELLLKDNRSFSTYTIPANTYENQQEDIMTVASANILVCRSDIDEETIYEFTKAFYENNDYLLSFYSQLTDAVAKNASSGQLLEFHPGAERYLKEAGIV